MKNEKRFTTVGEVAKEHGITLFFNSEKLNARDKVFLDYSSGNYFRVATRVSRQGNEVEFEELLDAE